MDNKHCVYYLESISFGSYYIGITNNVARRLKEHNSGISKSTSHKRPWRLVRVEEYDNINDAYKRERFLKAKKSKKIIKNIIDGNGSPDVR